MGYADGNPEPLDLIEEQLAALTAQWCGPVPGRVESYTPATQRADIAIPAVVLVDGVATALPTLRAVPVLFPGGLAGQASITWPLAAGDLVLLLPPGWELGAWYQSGAQALPVGERRWSLSDIVAIPSWPRPLSSPPASTSYASDGVVIGPKLYVASAAATDAAAKASVVDARLTALETFAASHVHPVTTAPGTTGVAPGAPSGSSTASAKVLLDG